MNKENNKEKLLKMIEHLYCASISVLFLGSCAWLCKCCKELSNPSYGEL